MARKSVARVQPTRASARVRYRRAQIDAEKAQAAVEGAERGVSNDTDDDNDSHVGGFGRKRRHDIATDDDDDGDDDDDNGFIKDFDDRDNSDVETGVQGPGSASQSNDDDDDVGAVSSGSSDADRREENNDDDDDKNADGDDDGVPSPVDLDRSPSPLAVFGHPSVRGNASTARAPLPANIPPTPIHGRHPSDIRTPVDPAVAAASSGRAAKVMCPYKVGSLPERMMSEDDDRERPLLERMYVINAFT